MRKMSCAPVTNIKKIIASIIFTWNDILWLCLPTFIGKNVITSQMKIMRFLLSHNLMLTNVTQFLINLKKKENEQILNNYFITTISWIDSFCLLKKKISLISKPSLYLFQPRAVVRDCWFIKQDSCNRTSGFKNNCKKLKNFSSKVLSNGALH